MAVQRMRQGRVVWVIPRQAAISQNPVYPVTVRVRLPERVPRYVTAPTAPADFVGEQLLQGSRMKPPRQFLRVMVPLGRRR